MNKYTIIRTIGNGSVGSVFLAKEKKSNRIYAIKKISIKKCEFGCHMQEAAHNEFHFLQSIQHPNIVSCVDYFIENKDLFMVLEYVPLNDINLLISYMKQQDKVIPECVIAQLFYDCLNGLKAIHTKSIIHRDIKPHNLLIAQDGSIKICDFSASIINKDNEDQSCIGTLQYMAPEVIQGQQADYSSDIWSLGCVLFELMTFICFLPSSSYSELLHFAALHPNSAISLPLFYSSTLRSFVESMLATDPSQRPSIDVLLHHSYFHSNQLINGKRILKRLGEQATIHSELITVIHSNHSIDSDVIKQVSYRLYHDSTYAMKNCNGLLRLYNEMKNDFSLYTCLIK